MTSPAIPCTVGVGGPAPRALDKALDTALDATLDTVRTIAQSAAPVHLDELDDAELLRRVDTKYLVHRDVAIDLVAELTHSYRVLDVQGCRLTTYDTRYFDTAELCCYQSHQTGRANRLKIRRRRYIQSDTTFFEVKRRRNTGTTEKDRIVVSGPLDDPLRPIEIELLEATERERLDGLVHQATTTFDRIALVAPTKDERLTIDFGLSVSAGAATTSFPTVAVVEVKRMTASRSVGANATLRRRSIRPEPVSKYCLAIALAGNGVRRNRLKPVLRTIDSIDDTHRRRRPRPDRGVDQ